MKRLIAFVSLFLLLFNFQVQAEEKLDFQSSYESYLSAYQAFGLARSAYAKHQTVATENELESKTTEILEKRAQLFLDYFETLKSSLKQSNQIQSDNKDFLEKELDNKIGEIRAFLVKLSSSNKRLVDLIRLSNEFETNEDKFQAIANLSIAQVSLDKIIDYSKQAKQYNQELAEVLSQIEVPAKDKPILDNWLADSQKFSLEIEETINEISILWLEEKENFSKAYSYGNDKFYQSFEDKSRFIYERLDKIVFYQKQILSQI